MTAAASCPDVRLLEQLATGTIPPAEMEFLAQHCERCPRCLGLLHSLQTTDPLVETMTRLRPPAPGAVTQGPAPDLTAGLTPSPDSACDGSSLDSSERAPEGTQEMYTFLAPAQGPDELGRLGPYRVLKVLGAGGMGIVFLAEDEQLRRRVALKVMRPDLAVRADSRERFLLEARAMAAVKDDHIVTIYQAAEVGGVPCLAMELLDGMPLNRWLQVVPRPAVAEVVRLGRQIALGLAAAHARGLIHRDIKPANIWLETQAGGARVKLLDFGLVLAAADNIRLTHSGVLVGTPAYMAPEQARGEHVGPRADLFSLGCVLYRLCTGRKPFRGETTLALLAALAVDDPLPVRELNPSVPAALSDLVMRLLAKDPAARPLTAQAVADDLGALEGKLAEAETAAAAAGRRRSWKLRTLVGALGVAAVLLAGIVVIIRDRQRREVARITVPEGHSAEVQPAPGDNAGQKGTGPADTKPGVPVRSFTLAPLPVQPEPVWLTALVRRPLRLPGVRSWNIEHREGVGEPIKRFAWSPAVQTVAVIDANDRTSLHSVDTGQVLAELPGASGPLAWAPDGSYLATAGPASAVLVWDAGGRRIRTLTGHRGAVRTLAWEPDGKRLASVGAGEKRILVWDPVKGEQITELGPLPQAMETVTWSPDGRLIACNVPEVGWHFWDVAENKLVNDPKDWQAAAFDFAPDGRSALVTGSKLDGYRVRDLTDGRELGRLSRALRTPDLARAWSPDGGVLAIPGDGCVELWRASLRRQLFRLPATGTPVRQVAFSSDGKLVMVLVGERLSVWEADTCRLRGVILSGPGYHSLTVSPEGYYTGDEQVERDMLIRVRENSGRENILKPAAFEQTHGFKNQAEAVHLLRPLEATLLPGEGQPMGPCALVRHPAALPGAVSWTVETCSARYPACAVAYRPDGGRGGVNRPLLATGSEDGVIRLWDPAMGKLVRMLIGSPVGSLTWSPDGQLLAAAGAPGHPSALWEADTGRLLRRLVPGSRVCWAPDGATLAIAQLQNVFLWDLATERYRSFTTPQASGSLAWSPDGKTLAVGVERATMLWDVASNKEVRKLEGPGRQVVLALAWSPDSKRLVTVEYGGLVAILWDVGTGKRLRQFDSNAAFISPASAWSADGKWVLLGSNRFTYLFDPETGRRALTLDEDSGIKSVALAPDGRQIATASQSGVRLFNMANGERTHTLEAARSAEDICSVALAPDGGRLVVCPKQNRQLLRILETATGRPLPAPPDAVAPAGWSPDAKVFVAGSVSGPLGLWDGVTMQPLRGLEGYSRFLADTQLAWSGDGQHLAVAHDPSIWIWSATTGKLSWQDNKQREMLSIAWSPDGRRLATARARNPVRLWEGSAGKMLRELPYALELAWSPDGKTLAGSSGYSSILIDPDSGSIRARVVGQFPRWSADGRRVVTCGIDGRTLHVSDAATGKLLLSRPLSWLPGPVFEGQVKRSWSADGSVLALTNGHEVHLYDGGGWPLGVLLPGDPYERLSITPDGHFRGTARVDREVRMVVLKRDGSSETLTPEEFAHRYGWQNDPVQVRLTD